MAEGSRIFFEPSHHVNWRFVLGGYPVVMGIHRSAERRKRMNWSIGDLEQGLQDRSSLRALVLEVLLTALSRRRGGGGSVPAHANAP